MIHIGFEAEVPKQILSELFFTRSRSNSMLQPEYLYR